MHTKSTDNEESELGAWSTDARGTKAVRQTSFTRGGGCRRRLLMPDKKKVGEPDRAGRRPTRLC